MFTPRLFKLKMHTRRVLIFKRGLPVFSFLLASLMLIWPVLWAEQKEQFSLAVSSDTGMTDAKINMEQVRFYAQDKKKQPLTVTAPRVLETDVKNQIITLYKPVATYRMEDNVEIRTETPYGLVNQSNQTLVLEDDVLATTDTGYKVVTKNVLCDNKVGVITGKAAVTVTGPDGRIKAEGFRLYNKGLNIDFTGKTDSTLTSKDGPIRITSQKGLNIDRGTQVVTAIQAVKVTQKNQVVTADKMVMDYLTRQQNPDSRIKKVEAFGHVVAESGSYKVTGKKGVYDPQSGIIVVTEDVVLHQGNSHMEGEKATLNMVTGESNLVPKKGSTDGKKNRVRGRLIPTEMKGNQK